MATVMASSQGAGMLASPDRRGDTSLGCNTDAGIQTASESDGVTDDDSSIDTMSEGGGDTEEAGKTESGGGEAGDDSVTTLSAHRIARTGKRPPAVFFGTPSKAEHERRDKYNAKVRTRRLLRRDSIELTRRKSSGWEGHGNGEASEDAEERGTSGNGEETDGDGSEMVNAAVTETLVEAPEHLPHLLQQADDPDATEEADWFGLKSGQPSSDIVSLPSTPTRNKGSTSRLSVALSDCGSSPGIGRTLHISGGNRPSPFFRGRDAFRSPGLGGMRSTVNSPQIDNENIDISCGSYYAASPSIAGAKPLQDSSRKANHAVSPSTSLSPLKVNLRQKMAAWADAKVKTPQSPEKKEWDLMRASIAVTNSAPSPTSVRSQDVSSLLRMAESVPLPPSPEKRIETVAEESTRSQVHRQISPSPRGTGSRQERAVPPPQTRLPRPLKTAPVKTVVGPTAWNANSSSVAPKPSAPIKRAFSAQVQSVNRLAGVKTSGAFNRSLPSSSSSSASSSPQRPMVRSARQPHPSSSPPTVRTAKAGVPIVRDARLIASRYQPADQAPMAASDERETEAEKAMEEIEALHREAAALPVRIVSTSSAGVGGARRVALTSTQPKAATDASRKLPGRIVGQPNTSLSRVLPSRPMRRINDYTRAPPTDEQGLVVEGTEAGSVATPTIKDVFRAAPAVPLLKSLHTQKPVSATAVKPDTVADRSGVVRQARVRDAEGAAAANGKLGRPTVVQQKNTATRLLPLSSAELSKLTSLHTQCNEAGVVQIRLVVVRKHGEKRPESPSSKFRRSASVAAAGSKTERLAREAQDRGSRAAQRSARFGAGGSDGEENSTGEGEDDSRANLMPGAFLQRPLTAHRRGAGDDQPYVSPLRRVSLKKAVRWHRDLFAEDRRGAADSQPVFAALKSCLRHPSRSAAATALDRFGNVAKAGKPIGSPDVKRHVVQVWRIMYDDDVADAEVEDRR